MPGGLEPKLRVVGGAIAAVVVACIALVLGRPTVAEGYLFPDSYAYVEWPADFVLAGSTRVFGARPIGYALFLDVFGTGKALVWAQTVFSFVAWSSLGWVAGRLSGTIVGCLVALMPPIWRWNACVLTESTSLSLMALGLALSLAWAERAAAGRRAGRGLAVAWALCTLFFAWSRDANLVLVPAFLLPAPYLGRRQALALGLFVLLVVGAGAIDSRRNDRSSWSLNNAFLGRVLPDPAAVERFQAAGMPLTPTVREETGSPGSRTQRRLRETDPEFLAWIASRGAGEYWRWILARRSSYAAAWRAIEEYHALDLPKYPSRASLPGPVAAAGRIAGVAGPSPSLTLLLPFFLLATWRIERRIRPALAAALAASAAALVYSFLCYHADAAEVHRHMLLGLVLQRVAFLVGLGGLLAVVLGRARRAQGSCAAPSGGEGAERSC